VIAVSLKTVGDTLDLAGRLQGFTKGKAGTTRCFCSIRSVFAAKAFGAQSPVSSIACLSSRNGRLQFLAGECTSTSCIVVPRGNL
jgi:hypothetical protein